MRAGLGVTLLAGSTVPDGVRTLGSRDGFPAMGHLDLRLHLAQDMVTEAVTCLADYVASSFSERDARPRGGTRARLA